MSIFDFFVKNKLRGRAILEMEKNGNLDEKTNRILQILRSDGVTDIDIENWWNMPDSEHKNIKKDDEVATIGNIRSLIDMGYSQDDELVNKMRQTFPYFEDFTPETKVTESGPLPYELKIRMMNYFNNLSKEELLKLKEESSRFPTMNAYIRFLIKQKRL